MTQGIKLNKTSSALLEDALSSVTRAKRRNLIIFSVLSLIVSKTGINPSSLHFPFFKMENLNQSFIIYGLFAYTLFSFISFLIHSISDYIRYKCLKDQYNLELALQKNSAINTPPDKRQEHLDNEFENETGYKPYNIPVFFTKFIYAIKILMDFIFPLLLGFTSLIIFSYTRIFL